MAGVKDMKKRAAVRNLLKRKKYQSKSDREVAAEASVNRSVVTSVRREMIALGEHPEFTPEGRAGVRPGDYQPGTVVRGGYVFDEKGRTVREVVWRKRQAAKKKIEQARKSPRPAAAPEG